MMLRLSSGLIVQVSMFVFRLQDMGSFLSIGIIVVALKKVCAALITEMDRQEYKQN